MDDITYTSPTAPKTHSRKRSAWELEDDPDEYIRNSYAAIDLQDTPAKRLQNRHGEAIKRQPIRYNAHKLLNHLAYTRFYVTANFENYSPRSSWIVLCMVAEQNEVYRGLCQILPSLYMISPDLQALAITTGFIHPSAVADQSLLRLLPLVTTVCVEASVVEEFERFRRDVGGPEGCVAVIDAEGNCVWTSTEFLDSRASIADGRVDLAKLQNSLVEVLSGSGNVDDAAMDED